MQVKADQLQAKLKNLGAIYLVSGDEPLLKQEACDQIRAAARSQGFTERDVFHITPQHNWDDFFNSANNLSLFSEKKILELRFNQKPNKQAQTALQTYCQQTNPDNILLIATPKLDAATKKTRWYKAVDGVGACIAVWPLDNRQLPYWIKQRFSNKGLTADQETIALIASRTEGNLLATQQEIEKLHLLYGKGNITSDQVLQATSDNSHYDVFGLVDACLIGNISQASKVLQHLKAEGVEAILVLWALTREIRSTLKMLDDLASGNNMESVFQKHRVWDKRKAMTRECLTRSTRGLLYALLQSASSIDRQIKGMQKGNPWESLLTLCLNFSGKRIA